MAISSTLARLLRDLPLPRGGSLLEIGEANWYGDVEPDFPFEDKCPKCGKVELRLDATTFSKCKAEIQQVVDAARYDDEIRKGLCDAAMKCSQHHSQCDSCENHEPNRFDIAKAFYAATFAPEQIVSIDFNGSPSALRLDLNEPIRAEQFDVIINHGTAEHIFNIGQVFRTMHDAADVGALLIHDAPFTGWIDHGFYCLHPTLFYDLAFANNYEVVKVAAHEIMSKQIIHIDSRDHVHRMTFPNNSCLFVALRKLFDKPFKIPMQGYYARTLSPEGAKAWEMVKA